MIILGGSMHRNLLKDPLIQGALTNFGADVKCADSGKAAIEMLQLPHNFDACFMDVQMPEMDGSPLPSISSSLPFFDQVCHKVWLLVLSTATFNLLQHMI